MEIGALPAFTMYQSLRTTGDRQLDAFRKSPEVAREIEYFKEKVADLETIDDFFDDYKLMQFVLSSQSMDEEIQYLGRIKKVLSEDRGEEDSLVNRLVDPRFKQLADTLQFDTRGVDRLKLGSLQEEMIEKYVQNEWEKSLGEQNPALREASYFARNIANVNSVYQLLGDNVMRKVVLETLGIPQQIAVQSLERQVAEVEKRLNVDNFGGGVGDTNDDFRITQAQSEFDRLSPISQALSDAKFPLDDAITRLGELRDRHDALSALDTPDAETQTIIDHQSAHMAEILLADGLIGQAERANSNIATHAARMSDLIALASDEDNAANLSDYKTEFADLYNSIINELDDANFTDPDTGTLNNFFAAGQGTITAQFVPGGDTISFSAISSTDFRSAIAAANTSFQSIVDHNDTTGAQTNLTAANEDFDIIGQTTSFHREKIETNIAAMNDQIGDFDYAQIETARYDGQNALDRMTRLEEIIDELRLHAADSMVPPSGYDRDLMNSQVTDLRNEFLDLLANANSTNNLLSGTSSFSYTFNSDLSHNLTLTAQDLNGSLPGQLPTEITEGDEGSFITAIGDIDEALQMAKAQLNDEFATVNRFAKELNPRGIIDFEMRDLADDLQRYADSIEFDTDNVLSPNAASQKITNVSTGNSRTLSGYSDFESLVISPLHSIPLDNADARAEILSSLNAATDLLINLNADVRWASGEVTSLQSIINGTDDVFANNLSSRTNSDFIPETERGPLQAHNQFSQKFLERYLILHDAAANEANLGGGGNSYLTGLLPSANNLDLLI